MTSPDVHEQPQFDDSVRLSNWDRCNWCGELRSAHGPDWSCPQGRTPGRAAVVILLVVGSMLTVGGAILWGVDSSSPLAQSMGAFLLLLGITIDIAVVVLVNRRRSQSR